MTRTRGKRARGLSGRPEDPYAVLGIGRRAGEAEIRRAYFEQVRLHPPEREAEKFQEIRAAYEQLRTPEARTRTGLSLLQPPPAPPRRRVPQCDLEVHAEDVVMMAWTSFFSRLAEREEFRTPDLPAEDGG